MVGRRLDRRLKVWAMLTGLDEVVIPYEASDFPASSALNGIGTMTLPWEDVLWATVTVGKAQRDLMRHGRYSFAELLHRVACMTAYFDRDDENRVVLTRAYRQLDPSEKGVVSFYSGMTFAKLYADKVLNIPWMMHISRYESAWSVSYGASTKRPDLFGCNVAGEWAVAEAKGRMRVTTRLVTKMKQQKSAVASIDGVVPSYFFGSATRFEKSRLALRVVDPPARPKAQDLPLDPAAWLLDYYRPIVDMLDDLGARREGDSLVARLPGTDVEIGAADGVVAAVRENRQREFARPSPRAAKPPVTPQLDHTGTDRRRLAEQSIDPESQLIVERITSSARDVSRERGGRSDGLYVRVRRL